MAQSSSFLFRIRFRPVKTGAQFEKVSICFFAFGEKADHRIFCLPGFSAQHRTCRSKRKKYEKKQNRKSQAAQNAAWLFPLCHIFPYAGKKRSTPAI